MTEEQKKLAADNHGLIFSFLRGRGLDEEEFYGLAAIGLCKAAMTYKADVAKFSTYAYRCMLTAISNEIVTKNRDKRIPRELIVSYDAPLPDESGDMLDFIDAIPNDINIEKEISDLMFITECLNELTDKERLIFRLLIEGYTMREIAGMLGYCYQNISKIKLGIVRKLIKHRRNM